MLWKTVNKQLEESIANRNQICFLESFNSRIHVNLYNNFQDTREFIHDEMSPILKNSYGIFKRGIPFVGYSNSLTFSAIKLLRNGCTHAYVTMVLRQRVACSGSLATTETSQSCRRARLFRSPFLDTFASSAFWLRPGDLIGN